MSVLKPFSIIVAADQDNGIGRDGALPWRLPEDMARFRRLTIGGRRNAVIMGRRTYLSIPARFRPLVHRTHIVLSRGPRDLEPGVVVARSLDEALFMAADRDVTWVAGGGEVYALALAHPLAGTVELTRVWGRYGCDAFFGPLPPDYRLARLSALTPDGEEATCYERYERR